MDELDMSGVDPLRFAEMRKRVATVKAYLAKRKPTARDRQLAAESLGIGTKQFMRLVAAWRRAGPNARAADLDGSTGGKGQRRGRKGGLSDEVRTMVAKAIDTAGLDAPLKDIVAKVRLGADLNGIDPPSRSSIWNMLMEARSNAIDTSGQSGVLTGTVEANVPVQIDKEIVRPLIAVAVSASNGAILDHSVSFDPLAPPTLGKLPMGKGNVVRSKEVPVREAAPLSRILGRRIGHLGIVHNTRLAAPAAALVRSRRDSPIQPADALTIIGQAIAQHNEARSPNRASAVVF